MQQDPLKCQKVQGITCPKDAYRISALLPVPGLGHGTAGWPGQHPGQQAQRSPAFAARARQIELGAQCAYTSSMSSMKAERLHLRVEPGQKTLLEAASRAAGDTVSGFVLRTATEAAADILADRRVFVLDENAWQVFDQALSRSAADVPGLRELLSAPTVLDQATDEPPSAQAGR